MDQGDQRPCDYEMTANVNGAFRPDRDAKTLITLERDHVRLIVNRLDDVFARERRPDEADEPKCKRNYTNSSTARLFPARPRPTSTISAARSGERVSAR
jgi:hypothetical protein